MSKPYIPTVTVTFRREFDGKVEREQTIAVTGPNARSLELAVSAVMQLAGSTPPQPAERP